MIGLSVFALATAAMAQVDPFDLARSQIQSRQNAEALTIVDSGQFDVNQQTSEGYSLLHYAAGAGNLEMVKALLARGADPTLKSEIGKWEGEGGQVPQVPPVSPVVTPGSSVPDGRPH